LDTIPMSALNHVEVLTDGASSVYGSDAIAGVVNFILKRDFSGLQIKGPTGVTKYHDLGNQFFSITAGKNFDDGKGNIAVNFEYSHQGDAYASGRPNLAVNSSFVRVERDPSGQNSDGIPDSIWVQDRRFPTFNNGGDFFAAASPFAAFSSRPFTSFLFQPDGSLIPMTGTPVTPNGLGGFSTIYSGGNGSNGREGTQLILSPILNRYSLNLLGHYTITDAFEPFIEAKFTRTDEHGSTSAPFFTGGLAYFGGLVTGSPREIFRTDNPFLKPAAANQIRALYGDHYTDLNGNHYLDPYESYYTGPDGIPDSDQFGFNFSRTVTDFGNRDEAARRDTYRVVLGTRGTFNNDWTYEVSANYGKFNMRTDITGNVNLQRYLLAIDAVRDPTSGNIVCRSQIDPSAAVAYEFPATGFAAFAASQLANDVKQCVPVNLFGEGNVSQAAKDYILQNVSNSGRASQFDLTAFVSGDSSGFLNLPGGPIGFVLGAEYRAEKMSYQQDPLIESGLTFYNSIGTFKAPANIVREAFGEIRLPIFKDVPFFQELTATGAARVSSYKLGHTGTVWAYNAGLEWSPVRDIRFRGNYARAVRAPNLGELFFPLSQNFATVTDPCSVENLNSGSSTRAANCLAAGVPAGYSFQYSSSLQFLSGGNTNLAAEKSDSITLGGVLQPRFLPGFSVSVDYFNIKVKNSINAPSAQQLINACYDLPSITNQFCAAFQRNPGPGNGPHGEKPGRILEGSLQLTPLNYAALKVRGIDAEIAYRKRIGRLGLLDSKLTYTHYFQQDSFLDPTNPAHAVQSLQTLGSPKNSFLFNGDFKTGPVTFGYKLRYLDHMLTSTYENFFSKNGQPPQNPDVNNIEWYHSRWYHNVRVGIDVGHNYNFYLGIDNVTNALPPLGLTGVGGGSGIYDNRGRFYYAGFSAKI